MTDFGSNSKRESSSNGGEDTNPTTTTATATATASWTRLKDPRIVRVSRAFGGKDRHSKVCTVRGLRDRRVRLSVPTAIQLYDLQERLGLNQPSKVVDWLLHAARHEIDELPPLQIPPGIMLSSHSDHAGKFKDAAGERTDHHHHQSWMRDDDEEVRHEQLDLENPNFLHRQQNQNHVSFSSLMSSGSSFGRWDPSSLTLSSHTNPIPISLGLTAHHQHQELQQMVYQSAGMMMTQPYLMAPTNAAFDAARTFSFNMTADRHPSQSNNNGGNQQSKRDDLHPT